MATELEQALTRRRGREDIYENSVAPSSADATSHKARESFTRGGDYSPDKSAAKLSDDSDMRATTAQSEDVDECSSPRSEFAINHEDSWYEDDHYDDSWFVKDLLPKTGYEETGHEEPPVDPIASYGDAWYVEDDTHQYSLSKQAQTLDGSTKSLSDYALMVAISNIEELTSACKSLTLSNRNKLKVALVNNFSSLDEYAAMVATSNSEELKFAFQGLSQAERNRLVDALAENSDTLHDYSPTRSCAKSDSSNEDDFIFASQLGLSTSAITYLVLFMIIM